MLTSGEAWKVVVERAPRGEWLSLRSIYELVSANVALDDEDKRPVAGVGKSTRWQRTVRNALQRHKQTDVEWDRKAGFRLPD